MFATLTELDTMNYVQIITTDPISFGNIAPDQSVTGTPFQFFVNPECPVGFTIPFKISVTSSNSSWVYYWNVTVHGCELIYSENFVDDEGNVLKEFQNGPR